tara:strand:- start:489 stop:653 length:165 start_codon:yes stop_codon:yes gene_type:complete
VGRYWIFVVLFAPLILIFLSFLIMAVYKTCEALRHRQDRRRMRNEKKSEIQQKE